MRARCRWRRRRPGARRAASCGWGCSSPGKRSWPRCATPSACTSWRSRTRRTFTCGRRSSSYDQDVQLVILRTARYDDDAEEVEFGEISVFLAPTFVITVRQGVASELRGARQRLEQRPELLAAGSSSALWAILDQVVDEYAPVVAGLERDIDQIEATVFSGAVAPTERIYSLRREATDFYRAVHPLLAVVATVERADRSPGAAALPARRPGPPAAGQRGGRRPARPARHRAGGQHGGDLGRADQGQRPAERHHRAAHHPGHGLPAADLRHRLLRPELRLAGPAHRGPAAFVIYGIGGLVVPLALLFWWLRVRMPHADTGAAAREPAGAGRR